MTITPYTAALCRPATRSVFGDKGFDSAAMRDNLALYARLIREAADRHGARLVIFPQFSLTHYTMLGQNVWHDAAITLPGVESEILGAACRAANAYAVVQTAEKHPAFPGRYFLSVAIITPQGEVGMVYRKTYAMSLRTSPGDLLERFLEVFGPEALFPVLSTPLGRLGTLVGAEVHWPEPVRELALKGAEVICNPVAAVETIDYLNRPGALIVRPVRAFENVAYLAMPNYAEGKVSSEAYDFNGGAIGRRVDDTWTLATIDIAALRAARAAPTANSLAQIQNDLHRGLYQSPIWPANRFADAPPADFQALIEEEQAAKRRLESHWPQWPN
ncbi:nitrilase-related carbon-nitrogen hydrolase [Novosphingobium sp.]|uniref:nitrilase-related carbon-nitrogen hydrolase n=1 Tax=Novosphingobium sp. TaxID=1874826 RepID=UPI0031D4E432